MSRVVEPCPEESLLIDFAYGLASEESCASTERHLDGCRDCQRIVADLALSRSVEGPQLEAPLEQPLRVFRAGETLGRYILLEILGTGGMGAVYSAYDPKLERKVAIKLLLPALPAGDATSRLRHEAQAMARLNHPNVVSVYDVDVVDDDQVFVVMELVDGVTLAQWLRAQPRTWREVLDVMLEGGAGLAAAHAAGLSHRDIKPSNILVSPAGRVRLADFGLAYPLTETQVAGTPAYMAPEQLEGGLATPRSDQFSFCVTLFEALTGVRPFVADDAKALLEAMRQGQRSPPAARPPLPLWLREALARGLSVAPQDRFPSMDALLSALRSGRARRTRWLAALSVGTGALVFGALVAQSLDALPQRCRGGEVKLGAVLPERELVRLRRTLEPALMARIEGFSLEWLTRHHEACAATRIRHEQSEHLMDLRIACLDRALSDLESGLQLSTSPGAPPSEDKLATLLSSLEGPDRCADAAALELQLPAADPPIAPIVAELRDEQRKLALRWLLGNIDLRPQLQAILVRAEALGYLPLEAEALQSLGSYELERGRLEAARVYLERAVLAAQESKHLWVSALAWSRLAALESQESDFDAGARALALAEAASRAVGGPAELEGKRLLDQAELLLRQEQWGGGLDAMDQAARLLERSEGPTSSPAVYALRMGAAIAYIGGDHGDAFARATRALERELRRPVPSNRGERFERYIRMEALLRADELALARGELTVLKILALQAGEQPSGDERVLEAELLRKLGDRPLALRTLNEVIARAAAETTGCLCAAGARRCAACPGADPARARRATTGAGGRA